MEQANTAYKDLTLFRGYCGDLPYAVMTDIIQGLEYRPLTVIGKLSIPIRIIAFTASIEMEALMVTSRG